MKSIRGEYGDNIAGIFSGGTMETTRGAEQRSFVPGKAALAFFVLRVSISVALHTILGLVVLVLLLVIMMWALLLLRTSDALCGSCGGSTPFLSLVKWLRVFLMFAISCLLKLRARTTTVL